MRGLVVPRPDPSVRAERRRGLIGLVVVAALTFALALLSEAADWPESATLVAAGLLLVACTAIALPLVLLPRELAKKVVEDGEPGRAAPSSDATGMEDIAQRLIAQRLEAHQRDTEAQQRVLLDTLNELSSLRGQATEPTPASPPDTGRRMPEPEGELGIRLRAHSLWIEVRAILAAMMTSRLASLYQLSEAEATAEAEQLLARPDVETKLQALSREAVAIVIALDDRDRHQRNPNAG